MPSPALTAWSTSSAAALLQLEAAHRAVGGTRAGRRTNTLQLNYAYVLLLAAHFPGRRWAAHLCVLGRSRAKHATLPASLTCLPLAALEGQFQFIQAGSGE